MRPHRPAALHLLAGAAVSALVLGGAAAAASPERADPGAPVTAQVAPSCGVHSSLGGYPVALHFSQPTSVCAPTTDGLAGRDLAIVDEVVRLTDAAPAGSSIHGHVFAASIKAVGAALEQAQRRGVSVRLSGTGALAESTNTVMADLNAVRHRWCTGVNEACVSSLPGAVSHAKLFTFSATTDPTGTARTQVTWISSSNLTFGGGAEDFNNAVTVYGDPVLYAGVLGYLDDLYAMSPRTADYFSAASGRGYVAAPSATVYASPQEDGDLVVGRLDDVTPGARCRVRVMQASVRDSRLAVVDHLVQMRRGGCSVRVVANVVQPEALARLQAAGIPVRQTNVHDKTFIVTGRFGDKRASRVYVGSHNLSHNANYVHDEVLVELAAESPAQRPVHDAFVAHFATAYASATPL